MTYRADIDGLRALAVLSVLGFHLFPHLAPGGFVGVDIFFVISGFLISSVLADDLDRGHTAGEFFRRFYFRRVRRIFPALVMVLAGALATGWVLLLPGEFAQLGKHVAGGAGFVANLLYWKQSGYFDQAAGSQPLLHLWSLGVEEQFYLLWPMILLLIWKTRSRMWVVAAAFAGSFALSLITVRHDAAAAFYSPLDRFWELMAGAALAFAARSPGVGGWWDRQTRAKDLCSLAGVVLIVTALWRIDKAAVFPGWKVLAPVAGTACIIAAGPRAWMNTTMFSRRPLVWMGLISYPLYLWHWPLLSLWRIVDGDPSVAVRTGIAAASIMLAAATYLLIERPLRFRSPTPRTIGMLCAMMALAAGAGAATFAGGGMPGRLPPVVQQIAGFRYDATAGFRGHRCLLYPELGEHVFAPECSDPDVAKEGLPEIVLWGDSHAAQLYPGILDRYGSNYRISQLTVAGCPPLFGVTGAWPGCPDLTAASFAELAAHRPALVVVAAAWLNYDWRALTGSVQRLHAAGVRKIIVVGGVPVWDAPLPELLARTALKDRPAFRVPERWAPQRLPQLVDLDRAIARLVRASAIDYESALDSLCNGNGCLTRANGELTAFDAAHLTPAGARYVVARFRSIP